MGYIYKECKPEKSIFWYNIALNANKNDCDNILEFFKTLFDQTEIKYIDYLNENYDENGEKKNLHDIFNEESQISNLEDEVSEMEEQLRDIEDSDSDEYSELQELIDEKNEQIEKLEESKITEPTEEMIEEKINDLVDDAKQNPLNWLEDLGYSNTDLKDWVDYDSLAEGLRDSDGIGGMNGFNSDYDTTDFNGETYVVMQTNG
jgi:vacuolar-type H+-ATPase subunit I/STV1